MQNWQPNGAELIIAGRSRINDAAAIVEMRLGVAPIEDVAVAETEEDGEEGEEAEGEADGKSFEGRG